MNEVHKRGNENGNNGNPFRIRRHSDSPVEDEDEEILLSFLPHIFLPRLLPTKQSSNLPLEEDELLRCFARFLTGLHGQITGIEKVTKVFNNWGDIQNCGSALDVEKIVATISSLQEGESFALYIRAQNAGMIITIDEKANNGVIVSSFPASHKGSDVMSTAADLMTTYPAVSVCIPRSKLLLSEEFAVKLNDLCLYEQEIAMAKIVKKGNEQVEIREVADPMFITQWMTAVLSDEKSKFCETFKRVNKKIRDEVNYYATLIPFRRSGMWMTMKVVLQLLLINENEHGNEKGTFYFKYIILKFLFQLLEKYYPLVNADITIQMMAKLARRFQKLKELCENFQEQILFNNLGKDLGQKMEVIRNFLDSNWNLQIERNASEAKLKYLAKTHIKTDIVHDIPFNVNSDTIKKKERTWKSVIFPSPPECPPRHRKGTTFDVTALNATVEEDLGIVLCDLEHHVRRKEFSRNDSKTIFILLETYIEKGRDFYKYDPVGWSRMTLTALQIIAVMDEQSTRLHPILLKHKSGISEDIFHYLLLPTATEMEMASNLEKYFTLRNNIENGPSLINEQTVSKQSFTAQEGNLTIQMKVAKNEILREDELRIAQKIEELRQARLYCEKLREQANSMSCTYGFNKYGHKYHDPYCSRCSKIKEERNYRIKVYERRLPSQDHEQNAVIYELQMPTEIACLRDALYLFASKIYGNINVVKTKPIGKWKSYSDISSYVRTVEKILNLGSTTKLFVKSHYSENHPGLSDEYFIVDNGYNCTILGAGDYPFKVTLSFENNYCMQVETNSPYEKLQWTVDSTNHSQNEVLSKKCECPQTLSMAEYVEFGSLRAGHRLQWRNLYRALVTRSLTFKTKSVHSLICQSIWQTGLLSNDNRFRENHADLFDVNFVGKLLETLDEARKMQQDNWTDMYFMNAIILIALRVSCVNQEERIVDRAFQIIRNCRRLTKIWGDTIQNLLTEMTDASMEELTKIRMLLVESAICCATTFCMDLKHMGRVLESAEDLEYWLKSIVRITDNVNVASIQFPLHLRNLLRRIRESAVEIEEEIKKFPERNFGFDNFVKSYWPDAENCITGIWTCHPKPQQVFFSNYKADDCVFTLQIDILTGTFLIDGNPLGRLPKSITHHESFKRVFSNIIFDVLPSSDSPGTLVTAFEFRDCIYSFRVNQLNDLDITEKQKDGKQYRLISCENFYGIIPISLAKDFSHWLDIENRRIEFRPIQFQDSEFYTKKPYIFDLQTMTLKKTTTSQQLINIKSKTFKQMLEIFKRLENENYVHVWKEINNEDIIEVELPRMSLTFIANQKLQDIISKEFRGMKVDNEQKIGTLIGLQERLLLKDINEIADSKRILLVPHGNVTILSKKEHQHIQITLDTVRNPPYFHFEVDKLLKRIQASQNCSAWLYLALLHASTSSVLPDPFTGLTGTESALQILQSARCWSCEPYDEESMTTLKAIESLSPDRKFYPRHLTSMQVTTFPEGLPSTAAHEGFRLIVKKLISDSERLLFAYTYYEKSEEKPDKSEGKPDKAEMLTWKSYSRHCVFYCDQGQLEEEFTKDRASDLFPCPVQGFSISSKEMKPTRIVASLGHAWNTNTFSANILGNLLITDEDLHVVHKIPELDVSNCMNISLREDWINLYNFARIVKTEKEEMEWILLLSLLAFNKLPLEHLLLLHAVVVNRECFVNIDPPKIDFYEEPSKNFCNSEKIKETVESCEIDFEKFLDSVFYLRHNHEDNYDFRRRMHDEFKKRVKKQITKIARIVSNKWPCSSCNSFFVSSVFPEIDIKSTKKLINEHLKKWYNNYMLKIFVEDITTVLRSLNHLSNAKIQDIRIKEIDLAMNAKKGILTMDDILNETIENIHMANEKKMFETDCLGRNSVGNQNIKPHKIKQESFDNLFLTMNQNDEVLRDIFEELKESWMKFHQRRDIFENELVLKEDFMNERNILNEMADRKFQKLQTCIKHLVLQMGYETKIIDAAGLFPKLTPSVLLPLLTNKLNGHPLGDILASIAVIWTMLQRINRCLKYEIMGDSMRLLLKKEVNNKGHENWSPREKPQWLLLELDMNLLVRPVQADVANAMTRPESNENSLMQLNMGEGKTTVILPLLIADLANKQQLCRVVVLKSLYKTNQKMLTHALGGLLNRRVYMFPCRRDMTIGYEEGRQLLKLYEECKAKQGVALMLPEHLLSFQLKVYEKCRNSEFSAAQQLLEVFCWLKDNARDILDESDEILRVKYQLIYTVGSQLPIAGDTLRWTVIQGILKLVPSKLNEIIAKFGKNYAQCENIENEKERFPCSRLFNNKCYTKFCKIIADDILEGRSDISLQEIKPKHKVTVQRFISRANIQREVHDFVLKLFTSEEESDNLNKILILRGILARGILFLGLNKRWRVNYGVNPNGHRLMAVPFRAKDIAAERTEFGHADVAILFTQLSYYYSGLNDDQLDDSFNHLYRLQNPEDEYSRWIQMVDKDRIHDSITRLNGINLSDYKQRQMYLYPVLRHNMAVIDFWLSKAVFPRETKQFPSKMLCSPWDLSSNRRNHLITGFSGTNDTRLLLPRYITQRNLPELQGTNGYVLYNLLKPENNFYKHLPPTMTCEDLLHELVKNNIFVLLDVGALILELTNEQLAEKWLMLTCEKDIDAAVFFDKNDQILVLNRCGVKSKIELSPYCGMLDKCIVYLDDIHTRGTDLKIPRGSRACVTLGKGVTKDKLVQGCMRMRMLGNGHTVTFWASHEVDNEIKKLNSYAKSIGTKEVLRWTIENCGKEIREGFMHWATAGLNDAKKAIAHETYKRSKKSTLDLLSLGEMCGDNEIHDLKILYGSFCVEQPVPEIVEANVVHLQNRISHQLMTKTYKRELLHILKDSELYIIEHCRAFVSQEKRLANLLEEEQERELEHELEEEKQIQRPGPAIPAQHCLRHELIEFVKEGFIIQNDWYKKLSDTLDRTKLKSIGDGDKAWSPTILTTKDFAQVIVFRNDEDTMDDYLRPVNWFIVKNDIILLLSPFEVNKLIHVFRESRHHVRLHMYAPKWHLSQDTLLNSLELCLPSSPSMLMPRQISQMNIIANLTVYSGGLYFKDEYEQKAYCDFIGYLPCPRNSKEDAIAEIEGAIQNGFVKPYYRSFLGTLSQCMFQKNPYQLIRGIIERRYEYFPLLNHVASIIIENKKPLQNQCKVEKF